jgi:CDP-diacylglycerol--glycerol-3-phosphate 3-phosphatidyltransferase
MTVANRITAGRFVVAIVYFAVFLGVGRWPERDWLVLDAAAVVFLVAVISDAVDGYYARKYAQVTNIGRIADPLVDKIVICGAIILFLGVPALAEVCPPWIVLLVVSREFTVQGVRSVIEAKGIPFGATGWGKFKMVYQSIGVTTAIVYAAHFTPFAWARTVTWLLMLSMALVTVLSGLAYLGAARRALR